MALDFIVIEFYEKPPKNCCGYLVLQSTCISVGYFNSCDFKFFIKA